MWHGRRLCRGTIIARNALATMHKSIGGRQRIRLVRPASVWTNKENISAIKSTT
jgi:hypothetical protein